MGLSCTAEYITIILKRALMKRGLYDKNIDLVIRDQIMGLNSLAISLKIPVKS